MTATRQILANQVNAQSSTDPRLDEGGLVRRSLGEGGSSRKFVILPGQEEEFAPFSEGLEAEFQPEGAYQEFLFRQILHAAWNLERCHAAEAELALAGLEAGTDPLLVETNEAKLRFVGLYSSRTERTLSKAVQELRRVQSEMLYRRKAGIDHVAGSPLAEFKTICPQLGKENLRARQTQLTALRAYLEEPPPSRPEPAAAASCSKPAVAAAAANTPAASLTTRHETAKQTKPNLAGFSLESLLGRNRNQC